MYKLQMVCRGFEAKCSDTDQRKEKNVYFIVIKALKEPWGQYIYNGYVNNLFIYWLFYYYICSRANITPFITKDPNIY